MKISAAMPAYNEEANLEQTVRHCFEVLGRFCDEPEVVVTNDGSTDGTAEILNTLSREFRRLIIARNTPNQGYGAALHKAVKAATGDIIVTLDSDGQFDIADIEELLPQFTDDVMVLTGYRRAKKDSFIRVFADRAMNLMIRVMFGVPYKDTNCALKLLRSDFIKGLPLEASGFQFPTELVLKSHALGACVREAPVSHAPRAGGQSGLAVFRTAIRMFVFLVYLRIKIALFKARVLRSL